MDLLYPQFSQLIYSAPHYCYDIDGVKQEVCPGYSFPNYDKGCSSHLRMVSAGGHQAQIAWNSGSGYNHNRPGNSSLPAELLGIQVGIDNTAVTPTERRLYRKIGHGRSAPDIADQTQESYTTGDDTDGNLYGTLARCQLFVPQKTYVIRKAALKLWKSGGAPPDLTVSIRGGWIGNGGSTADLRFPNLAYAPNLCSATILAASIGGASPGSLVEADFTGGSPVTLLAGRPYFIAAIPTGGDAANKLLWRYDNTTPLNYDSMWVDASTSGIWGYGTSGDSGATFSISNNLAHLFRISGRSDGEFEIGSCDGRGLTISNPNGEFTLQRTFMNNCGSSITVQEVGLTALANGYIAATDSYERYHPVLVARDVVAPGIAVAHGEILIVSYVPQITV